MELNFERQELMTDRKIFEGTAEQSIDTEITLPDYYPEVSKILTCQSKINIQNKQCSGGTATIGGQVLLTVLYLDPDGELNIYACDQPFTKTLETNTDCENATLTASASVNYINHKANAPRRFELHGSFTVSVSVFTSASATLIKAVENSNIFVRSTEFVCIEPIERLRKLSYIEDEINTDTKPAVAKLIRQECYAIISECKFLNQKAMVKGDLIIELVYLSADCRKYTLSRVHGFSQIIDCEHSNENTDCSARAEVISFETMVKGTSDGENKAVGFEAKLEIELRCSRKREMTAVSDAFSDRYAVEVVTEKYDIVKSREAFVESFVCKKSYELPECGDEILDIWPSAVTERSAVDDGKLFVKGTVNIAALYKTSSGETAFYCKPVDFEYSKDECEECEYYSASVRLKAISSTLASNGTVETEVEMEISVIKTVMDTVTVLRDIECDESEPITRDENTAVTLYFAENECVWEIAKHYKSSPKDICRINDIESIDTKCNKVLLVPNCL